MSQYLDHLDKRSQDILELLRELVEMETPTSSKQHTDVAAQRLAALFESRTGGTARLISSERYGSHVYGEWGGGDESILLIGHFDTVHPVGTLLQNPFVVEGDRVSGPGIYDMKGGIAQALLALQTLRELDITPNKKVICFFNSDEETGSPDSRAHLQKIAAQCKCAFVLEPSFGEAGAIKTSRRGVGTYTVSSHGKAAHAGNCPEEGHSAIAELCRQMLALQALHAPEQGLCVNCGIFHGGTAKNTVPEQASAVWDVRASTQKDAEKLESAFRALTSHDPGVRLTVEGGFTRPPMEKTPESQALFDLACALMQAYYGENLTEASVGGASDGNLVSALTATLDGLGAVGAGAHTPDEFLLLSQLIRRCGLLCSLIECC